MAEGVDSWGIAEFPRYRAAHVRVELDCASQTILAKAACRWRATACILSSAARLISEIDEPVPGVRLALTLGIGAVGQPGGPRRGRWSTSGSERTTAAMRRVNQRAAQACGSNRLGITRCLTPPRACYRAAGARGAGHRVGQTRGHRRQARLAARRDRIGQGRSPIGGRPPRRALAATPCRLAARHPGRASLRPSCEPLRRRMRCRRQRMQPETALWQR